MARRRNKHAPLYWERDGDDWSEGRFDRRRAGAGDRAGAARQLVRGRRLRALGRQAAAERGGVGERGPSCRRRARAPAGGGLAVDVLVLRRLPGIPRLSLPEYSEVFFGDEYRMLRGGAWTTDPVVARMSFRNWDYPQRRQIFSGVRCAPCRAAATQRPSRGSGSSGSSTRPTAARRCTTRRSGACVPARRSCRRSGCTTSAARACSSGSRACPSTTRPAGTEILTAHAAEIAASTGAARSSSSAPGRLRKRALCSTRCRANGTLERFVPLDASEEVLRASAYAIADAYPIAVHGIVGDFERDLSAIPPGESRADRVPRAARSAISTPSAARACSRRSLPRSRPATRSCSVSIS